MPPMNETDPSAIMEAARHAAVYRSVGMWLVKYALPVIILAGSVGNVLSFAVMLRRKMRYTSIYFYLMCLACADTVVLYVSGFKTWIRLLTGFEMLHVSAMGCKMFMFLLLLGLHMSAWIIVLVSLDRFVAVWFPFRAPTMCSVKRARIFVAVLLLLTTGTNIHVLWTIHLQKHPIGNSSNYRYMCRPPEDNVFMTETFEYLKLISYSILPFVIVLILNVCIIYRMIHSTKIIIHSLVGTHCRDIVKEKQKCQRRVTYMLLIITFAWLVLATPFTLHYLIASPTSDPRKAAINFLSKTVCFMLMYMNHSINFYLYCVSGRKFRNELKDMLCCVRYKRQFRSKRTSNTPRTPLECYNATPWSPFTPMGLANDVQCLDGKNYKEAIYG